MAFDITLLIRALDMMEQHYLSPVVCKWWSKNLDQDRFAARRAIQTMAVASLPDMQVVASQDHQALNDLLVQHRYHSRFKPSNDVGIAGVVHQSVESLVPANVVIGERYDAHRHQLNHYPALNLPQSAVSIYDVPGWSPPVLRVKLMSGHYMWLVAADRPDSDFELVDKCTSLLAAPRTTSFMFAEAQVPMLDLQIEPDLSWLTGYAAATLNSGHHRIGQAFQGIRIRTEPRGDQVLPVTGPGATEFVPVGPKRYVLDEPFIGFFTDSKHCETSRLPLTCFWADYDSWR